MKRLIVAAILGLTVVVTVSTSASAFQCLTEYRPGVMALLRKGLRPLQSGTVVRQEGLAVASRSVDSLSRHEPSAPIGL